MADSKARRAWTVPTDLGPHTGIRARLTKRGIGGVLAVIGNPVSWTVDPVTGCLPWLTLSGGQDPASQSARQQLLLGELGAGGGDPGAYVNTAPAAPPGTPGAPPSPGSNPPGSGSSGGGGNGNVPGSGPFAYIGYKPGK